MFIETFVLDLYTQICIQYSTRLGATVQEEILATYKNGLNGDKGPKYSFRPRPHERPSSHAVMLPLRHECYIMAFSSDMVVPCPSFKLYHNTTHNSLRTNIIHAANHITTMNSCRNALIKSKPVIKSCMMYDGISLVNVEYNTCPCQYPTQMLFPSCLLSCHCHGVLSNIGHPH